MPAREIDIVGSSTTTTEMEVRLGSWLASDGEFVHATAEFLPVSAAIFVPFPTTFSVA